MENLLSALRAAGESTRLRIIGLLGHGELTVSELVEILRQSQPRVSRHLKLLCEAGLIDRLREGTWVFYRLTEEAKPKALIDVLINSLDSTDPDVSRDRQRLAQIREQHTEAANDYFRKNAADWDRIRSLYVAEETVEQVLLQMTSEQEIDAFLDIGTGTGRMLELFAGQAKSLVGIDLSREMLTVARSNLAGKDLSNCQARQGSMYDLPIDNQSKDLIVFHQVLHFGDEPGLAIREAARVLKPGGTILVADFAPHDEEFLRTDHAHRRLGFATSEVEGWARTAGLELSVSKGLKGKPLTVMVWKLTKPIKPSGKTSLRAKDAIK